MAENIGNLFGESANPEMRGTIGPLYAIIASAATMVAGLAFFLAGKPHYVMRPSERAVRIGAGKLDINEEVALRTRLQQLWDWRKSDDAKAVWKISKIYLILVGVCGDDVVDVCDVVAAFWTVYNQQSDAWDQQGSDMDGDMCVCALTSPFSLHYECCRCFTSSHCITISPDTM